jgi:hypothetical protein
MLRQRDPVVAPVDFWGLSWLCAGPEDHDSLDLFLQSKKILVRYDGKFFLAVFSNDLRFHTSTDRPPSDEEFDK